MRRRGVRLDLFICMIIVTAIFWGLFNLSEKLGVLDMAFDVIGTFVEGGHNVADGEVGGRATSDTPRANSMQDLVEFSQRGQTFTIETSAVKYYNYGTFVADNYEWRILKIDDNNAMAVKLNVDNIQDTNGFNDKILPVGRIVVEQPGALNEMQEMVSGQDFTLVSTAYIDMDGEAKKTYISPMLQGSMILITLAGPVLGILAFVIYILAIFGVHAIFVKLGVFPPVFTPKGGQKS